MKQTTQPRQPPAIVNESMLESLESICSRAEIQLWRDCLTGIGHTLGHAAQFKGITSAA